MQPTYDPTAVVTAQQLFGPQPWLTSVEVTGPSGISFLNPLDFATQLTATIIAGWLGGQVVPTQVFTTDNHFQTEAALLMIKLPGNVQVSPGKIAQFFTHGFQFSMVQQMIVNEVNNAIQEETGVVPNPLETVDSFNWPLAPPPVLPVPPTLGFGSPTNNPRIYSITNPTLEVNGRTNVDLKVTSPDGAVWTAVTYPSMAIFGATGVDGYWLRQS
jgi:hypothetical protein